MDLENQGRIKEIAEKYGLEEVVVVLGNADPGGAEVFAETVTIGDPSYAGPLAGVSLGLPVYHIFELKSEVDPSVWQENVEMMELVLDVEGLISSIKERREKYSKYSIPV